MKSDSIPAKGQDIDLVAVVRKLVGPINPVGETNSDNARYENIKALTTLIEDLVADVEAVAVMRDRPEFSVQRAGGFANGFLNLLRTEE